VTGSDACQVAGSITRIVARELLASLFSFTGNAVTIRRDSRLLGTRQSEGVRGLAAPSISRLDRYEQIAAWKSRDPYAEPAGLAGVASDPRTTRRRAQRPFTRIGRAPLEARNASDDTQRMLQVSSRDPVALITVL